MVGIAEEGRASKRRPFFTSPDEIYEEYYEVLPPEKKRRLTSEQVNSKLPLEKTNLLFPNYSVDKLDP